ncbi:hypothetical protein V8G54_008951 [Vigna mungo]|uniref:Uncharacterized protein n=1 Tax=Vigna mungo TaxID=3915 RepID=A0AAQ3P4J7_VIGMU
MGQIQQKKVKGCYSYHLVPLTLAQFGRESESQSCAGLLIPSFTANNITKMSLENNRGIQLVAFDQEWLDDIFGAAAGVGFGLVIILQIIGTLVELAAVSDFILKTM